MVEDIFKKKHKLLFWGLLLPKQEDCLVIPVNPAVIVLLNATPLNPPACPGEVLLFNSGRKQTFHINIGQRCYLRL